MRPVYQITGIAFLLLGAVLAYHALRLRYYTPLGPGPGFFPLWLCGLLMVLALCLCLQARFKNKEPLPADFFPARASAWRIGAVLIGLLAVAALLPLLGFRLTMLGFYLGLLWVLGQRHVFAAIVLALIGSFGTYTLFVEFLSQPLPIGKLGI